MIIFKILSDMITRRLIKTLVLFSVLEYVPISSGSFKLSFLTLFLNLMFLDFRFCKSLFSSIVIRSKFSILISTPYNELKLNTKVSM